MDRPLTFQDRCFQTWDRLCGRDYRNFLLRRLQPGSAGCEIGVWAGDFSAEILRTVRPARLVLIDPWLFQPEFAHSWYGGALMKSQTELDALHTRVVARFAGRPEVTILRGKTEDVATRVPAASLDWIYIDGNHDYEHVRRDLAFARRVVKPGGLILGDDFDRGDTGQGAPVTRAVTDAAREAGSGLELLWVCRHQFCLHHRGASEHE